MKLYVIRHGQSKTNVTGCYTGHLQIPLTEKGIKDAEGVRPFLRGINFDKIYSSDLIRAKNTAETALPGCTYEETPLLREVDLGSLCGKNIMKCREELGEKLAKSRAAIDYSAFGGETKEEFYGRVRKFLDNVADSGYKIVAAFSHAGTLRTMLDIVLDSSISRSKIRCRNCAIAVFEHTDGEWYLDSWINTTEI